MHTSRLKSVTTHTEPTYLTKEETRAEMDGEFALTAQLAGGTAWI